MLIDPAGQITAVLRDCAITLFSLTQCLSPVVQLCWHVAASLIAVNVVPTGDYSVCVWVRLCVCVLVDHQFAHGEFSDLCSFFLLLSRWPRGHRSYQTYIHPCRSLPQPWDAAWQPSYGIHTNLHPGDCALDWNKVKYWLHFTEQTSEEVSVLTYSVAAAKLHKLCRATGFCIFGWQGDRPPLRTVNKWLHFQHLEHLG